MTRTPLSVLARGTPTTASFQFIDCPPNHDGKSLYYAGVLEPDQQYSDAKLNPAKQTVSGIPVKDLRGSELSLSLEQHGLQFVPFPYHLSLRVESDKQEIFAYIHRVNILVKQLFKAELVFTYDYKFRKNMNYMGEGDFNQILKDLALTNDRSIADPASFMTHVDATPAGAIRRLRRYMSEKECKEYLDHPEMYRVRIINVWRPVARAVYDRPLGLLDYFSTVPEDYVKVQFHTSTENVGEVYWMRYNKDQQWYYINSHTPEELLMFLNYDSDYGDGPKCIPHCSFQHPDYPDSSDRQSIELRIAVICRKED
ncbi:hypothetical protein CONLIGDRAFT_632213 [Coniochaeta ligniaria NRRL 30616]|uniref:CmcJ-like methyltransferase n=1 Tax=Coniochaeta ligniaria NRRL 30616 TaxID=1408157 RepID=A0A1J7JQT2_9PEZI|nr:hypothetical protein CONLIGDRAFT_632213 [Coniochaeta ligniaria NRRL 30616]